MYLSFLGGYQYCYDSKESPPFRVKYTEKVNGAMTADSWSNFNGINEFTLVEPEPEMESWYCFRYYSQSNGTWYDKRYYTC